MFNKIKIFLTKNRYGVYLLPSLFFVAFLVLILLPETAFAARVQWSFSEEKRMEYLPYVLNVDKSTIRAVWGYFMHLTNIILIVMVVVVAFSEMLHLQIDTYGLKKILPTFLLGVLAANFSFIICRLIIDVGNAANLLFLHEINNAVWGSNMDFLSAFNPSYKQSADGATMIWIGVMGFFDFLFAIAVAILKLYISFVLLARDWVILALVAVSPGAFIALAFPPTKQYFGKWWSMILKWTFMPVAINAIIWFAAIISHIFSNVLVNFFIYLGALYLASKVPTQMGGGIMQRWTGLLKAPSRWLAGWGQRRADRNPTLAGIAKTASNVLSPDRIIKGVQDRFNPSGSTGGGGGGKGEQDMDNSPIVAAARGREAQEKYYTDQAEAQASKATDREVAEKHQSEFYGDTEGKNFGDPGYGHGGAMYKLATNTKSKTNEEAVERMAAHAGYYTEKKDKGGNVVKDKKTGKPVMVGDSQKMREEIRRMDPKAVEAARKWMDSASAGEIADGLGTSIKDAAQMKVTTQNFMKRKGAVDAAQKKDAQTKSQSDTSQAQGQGAATTGTEGAEDKEQFGNNGQGQGAEAADMESELERRRAQGAPDWDELSPEEVEKWKKEHPNEATPVDGGTNQTEAPKPETASEPETSEPNTQDNGGAEKPAGDKKEEAPTVVVEADHVDLEANNLDETKPQEPPVPPLSDDATQPGDMEGLDEVAVEASAVPEGTPPASSLPSDVDAGTAPVPVSDLETPEVLKEAQGGPAVQEAVPTAGEQKEPSAEPGPNEQTAASVIINTDQANVDSEAVHVAEKLKESGPSQPEAKDQEITVNTETAATPEEGGIGESVETSGTDQGAPTPIATDMSKIEEVTSEAPAGISAAEPATPESAATPTQDTAKEPEPPAQTVSGGTVIVNANEAQIKPNSTEVKVPSMAQGEEAAATAETTAGETITTPEEGTFAPKAPVVAEPGGALPNGAESAQIAPGIALEEKVPEAIETPIEAEMTEAAEEMEAEEAEQPGGEEAPEQQEQAGGEDKEDEETDTDKLLKVLKKINGSIAASANLNEQTLLRTVTPEIVNSVKAHQATSKNIASSMKDPRLQKRIGTIYARALKQLNRSHPESVVVSNIKKAATAPGPITQKAPNPASGQAAQGAGGSDQIGNAIPRAQQQAQPADNNAPVINRPEIKITPQMTGQPKSTIQTPLPPKPPIPNNRNIPPSAPNGL